MHDETNAIGLSVTNKHGDRWTLYGDKRYKDQDNSQRAMICQAAVQASADEIYKAWKEKKAPSLTQYAVGNLVPDLEKSQTGKTWSRCSGTMPAPNRSSGAPRSRTGRIKSTWLSPIMLIRCRRYRIRIRGTIPSRLTEREDFFIGGDKGRQALG